MTSPETTASPSPLLASTTTADRSPVTGSAVNITPANSASTISWTTTAIRTSPGSIPCAVAVGDRALGPQRAPAPPHRVEHGVVPDDVEVRVLLAGERRAGQVLRSRAGADRDRSAAQVPVRLENRGDQPVRYHDGCERRADRGSAVVGGESVGDHRSEAAALDDRGVGLGGDDEPVRDRKAALDQLPEFAPLPPASARSSRPTVFSRSDEPLRGTGEGIGHDQLLGVPAGAVVSVDGASACAVSRSGRAGSARVSRKATPSRGATKPNTGGAAVPEGSGDRRPQVGRQRREATRRQRAHAAGQPVGEARGQPVGEPGRDQRADHRDAGRRADLAQERDGGRGRAQVRARRAVLRDQHHDLHRQPDAQADQQQDRDQSRARCSRVAPGPAGRGPPPPAPYRRPETPYTGRSC